MPQDQVGPSAAGPCKRDMSTLVHIGGGRLVVMGGRNEAGRTLGDLWMYDTSASGR